MFVVVVVVVVCSGWWSWWVVDASFHARTARSRRERGHGHLHRCVRSIVAAGSGPGRSDPPGSSGRWPPIGWAKLGFQPAGVPSAGAR